MNRMKINWDTLDGYDKESIQEVLDAYAEGRHLADKIIIGIVLAVAGLIGIIALCMFTFPKYGVWSAEQKGKAQLAEAEYSKQVLIQEAQSNLEAEKLNAEAEVERAKGAAEARKTEGLGMSAEQYIQYLWVKKLDLSESKTIYLPTEGGLPKVTMEVEK